MEALGPYMYHERQEPGSMMCGQHALNNLLQGNYFTAPDLAHIAQELDQLEQVYNQDAERGRSTNMDDTGYFSVQVLENGLRNTFNLTLTRWRSEEMRPFQSNPDAQLAFVLNLEQHWFTLRRFGSQNGKGFWFNLNSFLQSPEWVGSTYLGMVLQQAEKEGYSVFVVRPVDPNNPEHILPETEADILAETLDETAQSQTRSGTQLSTARTHSSRAGAGSGGDEKTAGFEDEDMELQRALQASLGGGHGSSSSVLYEFPDESGPSTNFPHFQPVARAPGGGLGLGYGGDSGPPSRRTPIPASSGYGAPDPPTPEVEGSDPVAASAARARARLQQMQMEQTAAMQTMGGSGGYGFGAGMASMGMEQDPEALRRQREAQDRVRRAREEEEEQIRLAMAESLKSHGGEAMDDDDDDEPRYFVTPPTTTRPLPGSDEGSAQPGAGPTAPGNRHYDDEDAELQAALKASLEHTSGPGQELKIPSEPEASRAPASAPMQAEDDEDEDDEVEEEEEEKTPAPEAKAEVADPDEIRRRRLARFGG